MLYFREFLIFAPKVVRPDMVYEVHVTVNRKYYSNIVVTALLSSDGNEYVSGRVPFQDVGTKIIQLKVCSCILNTHAQNCFTAVWILSGTTWVSQYQKKIHPLPPIMVISHPLPASSIY